MNHESPPQTATLGGGCFWCVEAVFQLVRGVRSVESGYAGGTAETANYKAVCSGNTHHAEVARISFDPAEIGYEDILQIFFASHDPTTLNRQGNDVGPQYRSVIFYHDDVQRELAEKVKATYAPQLWDQPIVTEITPLETFYPAELYHQNYYRNVGDRNPYCTYVITPKINKFKKQFSDRLLRGKTF